MSRPERGDLVVTLERVRGIVRGLLMAIVLLSGASFAIGQTQLEMNGEAETHLRAAEADLKKAIESLESKAKGKTKALEILRSAQAAWETYRDAQLRALWPFPDTTWYGSVNPMCAAEAKAQMTRTRTRELRTMLSPTKGDVCSPEWPE